jgi:hypothetical protein
MNWQSCWHPADLVKATSTFILQTATKQCSCSRQDAAASRSQITLLAKKAYASRMHLYVLGRPNNAPAFGKFLSSRVSVSLSYYVPSYQQRQRTVARYLSHVHTPKDPSSNSIRGPSYRCTLPLPRLTTRTAAHLSKNAKLHPLLRLLAQQLALVARDWMRSTLKRGGHWQTMMEGRRHPRSSMRSCSALR